MSGKVVGILSFLVFALAVTSFVSAVVGKLYERAMTFLQHWAVALISWNCVFVPGAIWSVIHSEVVRIPALVEVILTVATLVIATFVMTYLARSWHGVSQALGFKVVPTVLGLAAVVIAIRAFVA